MRLRAATPDDLDALVEIWHDGWRDGHVGSVPGRLVVARSAEALRDRMPGLLPGTVVAEVDGEVAGFVSVVDDELDQVYVAASHRGTGIADELLADGEARVAARGYATAWLVVVGGNSRARAFYERHGWVDDGEGDYPAPTGDGPIVIRAHRYTKRVG